MSADELVRAGTSAAVATIALNSPHNRNALSSTLIEQLLAALEAAVADPDVRVIVLTHTGTAFCSGADLAESAAAFTAGRPPAGRLGEVLLALWECPKPVLARVAGPARAGGVGLVAAADLAVCARTATFAFSEVRIGVIPAVISATVLPRLAPRAATELFLTGEVFDGERAERIGLVTAAVPAEELDTAVARYVSALLRGAPGALAGTKELLRQPGGPPRERLDALTELSVSYFRSAEAREGIRAFRDKTDPSWIVPT